MPTLLPPQRDGEKGVWVPRDEAGAVSRSEGPRGDRDWPARRVRADSRALTWHCVPILTASRGFGGASLSIDLKTRKPPTIASPIHAYNKVSRRRLRNR